MTASSGTRDPKTGKRKSTYILIPRGITKHIPGAHDSQLKISKQSFNLVLQGGLQPGFGPLVAYPVGKIQTAAPQLNDIAKLVNPYGPPDGVWDAVAPSTLKALSDAVHEQSEPRAGHPAHLGSDARGVQDGSAEVRRGNPRRSKKPPRRRAPSAG
jgi:hypothetical protein